ncbi:hypothetical protein BCR37DRAFT_378765 [Protomyces lactucae-debilis]|uniref:Uncharacterized protein n=1 Tax=Protomyces lactucae-debilis TaxID=2754530 RepID=A0A1Y2FIL1_PROLT|nr:uncharacterized protein BCR37DRAFT_378765 [Protomyces lactucae-debilis]ORY83781.1 hypothetical protein BCR37DRAFT_378765 [Protomyces lactucae-debilis]
MADISAQTIPSASVPVPTQVTAPPASLWDRISTWTADNKATVFAIAGGLVIVAGGSYYLYSKRDTPPPPSTPASDSPMLDGESAAEKKERKRKKTRKAASGPSSSAPTTDKESEYVIPALDAASASGADKKKHADLIKKHGNTAYAKKDYNEAIALYSKAIEVVADPVYYSNRSACHAALKDEEAVIRDTTEALRLDPSYVKALNRRAQAYEHAERYQEALLDYTAASIMDNFANPAAGQAIERLLRNVAEAKAKDMLSSRTDRMPSVSFISAYLDAFRPKEMPTFGSEDEAQGDVHLKRAMEATTARDYKAAVAHLEKAHGKPFSTPELEALALNASATYKFVRADVESAMRDVNRSLELQPTLTNSLVKRASMHMEMGDRNRTLADFDKAIDINPEDPDIYYHRGQCNFILQDYATAAKDYQKSIDLDPDFVFSHVQLGVSQYKLGSIPSSMSTFRRSLVKFPESAEVYNYFGELLLDQGKFEEAVDKFDTAISLERAQNSRAAPNVMPLINKALCMYQWKKDIFQAEELCRKALMLDPESDVALATLSQFLLTQGKAKEALQYFERSAQVARTEAEIINALSYAEATRTQLEVERKYPDLAAKMAAMAGPRA